MKDFYFLRRCSMFNMKLEQTQACAKLYKILSKKPQISINNVKTSTGEFTKTGGETAK